VTTYPATTLVLEGREPGTSRGYSGPDEYVIFLDSRDELMPRWRQIVTEALGERRPRYVTWGVIVVGPDGLVRNILHPDSGRCPRDIGSFGIHRSLLEQAGQRAGAATWPRPGKEVLGISKLMVRRGVGGASSSTPPPLAGGSTRRRPENVSVIVPLFRGAAVLGEQLEALASQTYTGRWEVVFADNGSTDGSAAIAQAWRAPVPVRVIHAPLRGPSHARNRGFRAAAGELLLFTDQDDVVAPNWVDQMVAASTDADAVGGALDTGRLNASHLRHERVVPGDTLFRIEGRWLPFASGNNFAVWRDSLDEVGGWHEGYVRSQDTELSWRLQLSGYRLAFAPRSVVHYRLRTRMAARLRQTGGHAADIVRLYRDYGWAGAPRRSGIVALKAWALLVLRSPDLFRGRAKRARWLRTLVRYLSFLRASVRQGVFHP
jgi:glycosyltransferase involved in cell wall biosynthesis